MNIGKLLLVIAIIVSNLFGNSKNENYKQECTYNGVNGKQGTRYIHKSGFILDLINIKTVPQSYIWVNTRPVSDRGEPHTLEHLLLGKGTKGYYNAELEQQRFASSSAYTMHDRTCYHFYTEGNMNIFYELFYNKMDALLYPTFTDEEIRREVCNIGYKVNDGEISLEEKGSVYTEMVANFEKPWGNIWFQYEKMINGEDVSSGFSSGGYPPAIREMKPDDIRSFHKNSHQLNNMGAIVVIPDSSEIESFLIEMDKIFYKLDKDCKPREIHSDDYYLEDILATPVNPGVIRKASFPDTNDQATGNTMMFWPTIKLSDDEDYLLSQFLSAIFSGEGSEIFDHFVNKNTAKNPLKLSYIWANKNNDSSPYQFQIGLTNIDYSLQNEDSLKSIKNSILNKLIELSNMDDDDIRVSKILDKMQSAVDNDRKWRISFLSEPPKFGYRDGGGSGWMNLMLELHKNGGTNRDLTLRDKYDRASKTLSSGKNIWREIIAKLELDKNEPAIIYSAPDVTLLAREKSEKEQRLADYARKLETIYSEVSKENVILKFVEDYDKKTAEIDKISKSIVKPTKTDYYPRTNDDLLDYRIEKIGDNGNFVYSKFDHLSGGSIGLYFSFGDIQEDELVYLSAIPSLIKDSGLILDGKKISPDETYMLRNKEIYDIDLRFNVSPKYKRYETLLSFKTYDDKEIENGFIWFNRFINDCNLSYENLNTIRENISSSFENSFRSMSGAEENWVHIPKNGYEYAEDARYLSTDNFFTKMFNYFQLKWMLTNVDDNLFKKINEIMDIAKDSKSFIDQNSNFSSDDKLLAEFIDDLKKLCYEMPENSSSTFEFVKSKSAIALKMDTKDALETIESVKNKLFSSNNVRGYLVTSDKNHDLFKSQADNFIEKLPTFDKVDKFIVNQRMDGNIFERYDISKRPVYAALVNNKISTGTIQTSYKTANLNNYTDDDLLNIMAGKVFSGSGVHSSFMRTWSAGLAYSNGLSCSNSSGNFNYYAERCPDVAQMVNFLAEVANQDVYDESLRNYVASQFFYSRSAGDYDERGIGMASDIENGITEDLVKKYREDIIRIAKRDDFIEQMKKRAKVVLGGTVCGIGENCSLFEGALNFVIGSDDQIDNYEKFVSSKEGSTKIVKIYPSDYWF
ncbi:MAG: hypothetical protein JXR48_18620 [Candidatus Delongbacteria bacterium]|nr:hypothetical protein [Candidatus Delongbacteria bacterium]